ncbi:hypothetical protein J5N97_001077 [Dioscorea zingiberensis]|uniref:RING-type domain-containing protein n=1 Tax=Dioscorea zingiberensis TaxID=325984 RepID=A0A9D5BVZ2_9LILI|nr:hypothetical protein J5N97_001077 [Dioscorea zingiberensis]
MAVQAQYPANALFLHRSEAEMKTVDYWQDQSAAAAFFANGGAGNPRKRGGNQWRWWRLLAVEDQSQTQSSAFVPSSSSSPLISSLLSDDLTAQINLQRDEIDRFLRSQADQLRMTLTQTRHRHYRSLLAAAEEAAARRLREKDAEVERATRRGAKLEGRLTRLRSELMAWQAKALSDQAAAASLHAQLQQAAAAAAAAGPVHGEKNEPPADDAESAHIDPARAEPSSKACRACHARPLSVVLMPCRHLCLCSDCDAAALPCPVCRSARTGSVQVLLS